ncbi:MAG: hypothetical protein AMXMBFR75_01170 [Candidatus Hinthialibacteria bacterium]
MFDISSKANSARCATAVSILSVSPATIDLIKDGKIPKGDPLPVARVAAIQAAKDTSRIIPFCHPIPVEWVEVAFELSDSSIKSTVTVKNTYKTGVEVEAMTAASVAALTLYDMLKMVDEHLLISEIRLESKKGGKSAWKEKFTVPPRGAVVVMSDTIAAGKKSDTAGLAIVDRLKKDGVEVIDYRIIPDEPEQIKQLLIKYSDADQLDLVITTGGTGLSPRDFTPEATAEILDREAPGIIQAAIAYGNERTPRAMLGRGKAGARGKTLIINLPGSRKGTEESLDALFPSVLHALKMIAGGGH